MDAGAYRNEALATVVFGLPGRRPPAESRRKGNGVVMVPEDLVARWEAAYRKYGSASKLAASSPAGDRDAARAMASASWEVAARWREIEREPDLPWWALAAVCAAAQGFEFQARDWTARADYSESPSTRGRPQQRLTARARPRPGSRRAREESPRSMRDEGSGDEYR